jgi:mono/diheme cytochrome c family protein
VRPHILITAAAVAVVATSGSAAAGRVLSQEPTRTIWDRVFSDEQASRGQRGYAQACAACHADDLLGNGNAPPLVGEAFLGRFNRATADELVLTVRQTMPQEAPDSLGLDAYVDIVTYVFKANGSPAGTGDLPADRAMLKQVIVTPK